MNVGNRILTCFAFSLMIIFSNHSHALVFTLPPENDAMIGEDGLITARQEDTLVDIARANDLGFDEIINANPAVDAWLPKAGTLVTLPHRSLLPASPQEGIVVNVAEMRLYYYPPPPKDQLAEQPRIVESFPISIGRSDWNTPLISTTVANKVTNPDWHPPISIREEHAADGDPLPEVVVSGPDNPLGLYALYLGVPSYLIHGTNKEFGIGMQVTHGCMRMYPEDIQHLYETVAIGTKVNIVNQPYKVGWHDGILYLEVHPWLEGSPIEQVNDKSILIVLVQQAISDYPFYPVDWHELEIVRAEANGQPTAIGPKMNIFEYEDEE